MAQTITQKRLSKLLTRLMEQRQLIAPVSSGKDTVFDVVEDADEIVLDYANTVKSPKEWFLPQQEALLSFGKKAKPVVEAGKRVLFGVRPCDLAGIAAMDHTFREGVEDPHYVKRRANTLVIALGCTRLCDDAAFCESMGAGPIAESGYDLQLIEAGKGKYMVEAGSNKGKRILREHRDLLAKAEDVKHGRVRFREAVDPERLAEALGTRFDDEEFWIEASKTCIRCAACNYLCPSCFCFNVKDTSAERLRGWDSCMLRGFTREAAGHIPRNELYTRFRQRMYHKYRWHLERYGVHMCTGCGRCVTYCPGHVPYHGIIKEVVGSG